MLEKRLGSLPVIADFSRRLDIAGIIDGLCPIRDVALGHAWPGHRGPDREPVDQPVGDGRDLRLGAGVGGPGGLRDRRRRRSATTGSAGRWTRSPSTSTSIVGSVGAAAIDVFGIDVTRLHWDMTSISLYGAYDHNDPDYPRPGWGHPKDRRTDLKQIQAGIAVSADGAIPVFHQAYDGGAGEVAQVIDAMHALQDLAAHARIPDGRRLETALLRQRHRDDRRRGQRSSPHWPQPGSRPGCSPASTPPPTTHVDYVAQRDASKPAEQALRLPGHRRHHDLPAPAKPTRCTSIRRILVHSSANQPRRRPKPAH